jgi:uncharacterized protein YjbJ (UPF0337 family)
MGQPMNSYVFAGKWKPMRRQAKEWWGKLTEDDLEKVDGKRDKLIGFLQARYGYALEKAEEEIKRRVASGPMAGRRKALSA